LRLNDTPPSHTVEVTIPDPFMGGTRRYNTSLALFDAQRDVAIALNQNGPEIAGLAQRRFALARQTRNLNVHVFYNPGENLRDYDWNWEYGPSTESMQAVIPALRANLNAQITEFVAFLRTEGIL